jgi:uncharacterized membrane protein
MASLQEKAEKHKMSIRVVSLPGTFCTPNKVLAYVWPESHNSDATLDNMTLDNMSDSFVVGRQRTFADDPRFGLIVLSEIASKALSPAVNDPGTAINIIGSQLRLLSDWSVACEHRQPVKYSRIEVPELLSRDMLDDAFTAIARDGSGLVEVVIRLQKALHSLATVGDKGIASSALEHARMVQIRAEASLKLDEEKAAVRAAQSQG